MDIWNKMKLFLDGLALQSRDSSHAVFLFIYLFPSYSITRVQSITRVLSAVQHISTSKPSREIIELLDQTHFSDYFLYGLDIG